MMKKTALSGFDQNIYLVICLRRFSFSACPVHLHNMLSLNSIVLCDYGHNEYLRQKHVLLPHVLTIRYGNIR
ncbi:MAG: hypothetical protein FWF78_06505 [Defluviitaleaceae bacterium]|nr:hypothetical protein [Defluviitaleaceae bacterium]